jgi:hypothetical protein
VNYWQQKAADRANGVKQCARCAVKKPLAEFDKNRGIAQSHCRPCRREYRQEWRKLHPDRAHAGDRRNNLARNYRMTPDDWTAMFEAQGRACAICRTTEPRGQGWHTDHSHATGAVRGILCHDCNLALGYYEKTILPNLAAFREWLIP